MKSTRCRISALLASARHADAAPHSALGEVGGVGSVPISKVIVMRYLQTIAVFAVLVVLSACVMTDAATRLAYDLEGGAQRLIKSGKNELEIEHLPRSSPEGISGDYTILLQAVQSAQPVSGTLAVGAPGGKRYGTSYHLNFVTVPKDLHIRKAKGKPTYLLLRKTGLPNDANLRGAKAVEVVSIR